MPIEDFVQRLRMNNIYPRQGFNPLQAPERPDFDFNEIARLLDPGPALGPQPGIGGHRGGVQLGGNNLQQIGRTSPNTAPMLGGVKQIQPQGGMNVVLGASEKPNMPSLEQAEAVRYDPYDKKKAGIAAEKRMEVERAGDQKVRETETLGKEQRKTTELQGKQALEKVSAEGETDIANTRTLGEEQRKTDAQQQAGRKELAGQLGYMDDPDDPTKKITVMMKPDGSWKRAAPSKVTQFGPDAKPDPVLARQEATRVAQHKQNREIQKSMGKDTLEAIDEVLDKNDQLTGDAEWATGTTGLFAPYAFGTKAKSAVKKLENIESRKVLELLGELKSQSRTGATGMGNLNMKEFGALQAAASRLDRTGSQEEYRKQLTIIREKLRLLLEDGPEDTPDGAPADAPANAKTERPKGAFSYNDLMKEFGGGQ